MKHEIDLTLQFTFTVRNRMLSLLFNLISPLVLIGIGVFADSAAMQWAGFVVWTLVIVGVVTSASKKNNALTIEQARKRLDELERGEYI